MINRRDGYWTSYHQAHTRELDFLVDKTVFLAKRNAPRTRRHARGRRKVHSDCKMRCICLLMVMLNATYRDMQGLVPYLNLPWDEPAPDHTTIARHFQRIPLGWLEEALAATAQLCMAEDRWRDGICASDSTGVETDRYVRRRVPDKTRHGFAQKRARRHLKWHVTAILDPKVILCSQITSGSTGDSPVLRTMLGRIRRLGIPVRGSVFCADRGYDSDENCRAVFGMGMIPHIKQRKNATNRGKRYRRQAGRMFDEEVYRYRGLVEGIFGAEEAEGHRLCCRYRKRSCQYRFGQMLSIGWNLEVLNRIECEKMMKNQVRAVQC